MQVDKSKLIRVDTPEQPVMRLAPADTKESTLTAALSPDAQTQTDTLSQTYNTTLPVIRHAPFPASASPTANAASNSGATTISQSAVVEGVDIGLQMPGEFTVGGSPAGGNGNFKVGWANENALTVFSGPATAYPYAAGISLSGTGGVAGTPAIVPGTAPMLAIMPVSAGGATVSPGTGWAAWPTGLNNPNVPLFAQVLSSTFPIAGNATLSPAGPWSAGLILLSFNKTLATAAVQSNNISGGWNPPQAALSLSGTTAGNTILVVVNFTMQSGVPGFSITAEDGVNEYSHVVSTSFPVTGSNTGTQVDAFIAQGIAGGTVNLVINGSPGIGNAASYECFLLEISGTPSGPGAPGFKLLTSAFIPPIDLSHGGNGGVVNDLPYSQISGKPTLAATKTAVTSEWLNSYDATTGLFTQTQPAFSDISGVAAAGQLPGASGSTQGAIELNTDLGNVASAPHVVATHLTSPLPVNQGGSGTTTPAIVAGTNVTVSGTWPNQTINASGGGGSGIGGVNVQSGAYTILSGDNGTLVALSTGSFTFTLPTTPPSSTWTVFVENYGSGTLTLAPGGSTDIDGSASSLSLSQNQGVAIFTDGTNYFTERGMATGGGGGGVSSLNSLTGALSIAAGTNITVTPSGSTITIAASGGGGGGSAVPLWNHPHFSNGWANNQTVGWGDGNMLGSTQNATYMMPFTIDVEVTASYFRFFVTTGGGATNFYDMGIYDNTGSLKANLGATHMNFTGAQKIAFAQGSVTFQPGLYWFAITSNRSSGADFAISGVDPNYYPSSGGGIEMFWVWVAGTGSNPYAQPSFLQPASGGTTTGGALNSSVTLVTLASINIYDTYEYFNNSGSAYIFPRFALSAY